MGNLKAMRKTGIAALIALALSSTAHALPVTTFVPTTSGGFEGFVYPVLADGSFSFQSAIFALPIAVNPGFVVIVADPTLSVKDPSNWTDVIRFINDGNGKATTMQMFVGGPDQASYFPTVNKVLNASHIFIANSSLANGGWTDFTDYSVSGSKVRTYHFFTGAIPEGGSTLALLGIAFAALFLLRGKLVRA
jgi:hypothetical protein